jgi:hypothetical protein
MPAISVPGGHGGLGYPGNLATAARAQGASDRGSTMTRSRSVKWDGVIAYHEAGQAPGRPTGRARHLVRPVSDAVGLATRAPIAAARLAPSALTGFDRTPRLTVGGRLAGAGAYGCIEAWRLAMHSAGPAEAVFGNGKFLAEWQTARTAKLIHAARATRSWEEQRGMSSGRGRKGKAEREPLIRWYRATLQPHLIKLRPVEIQRSLDMSRSLARHIIAGEFPHPRHLPALAKLAGVELPRKFTTALSTPAAL